MEIENTILDDIAAVVGLTPALRLAAWFGDGNNLYVPTEANEGQLIARLIGISAAKRLSAEFGNQHLAIPRIRSYETDLKRRLIARMLEQRFSTREIATIVRMSERRVQQVCRELEQAGLIDVVIPEKKPSEKAATKKASSIFPTETS
jgi:hypothetical protein